MRSAEADGVAEQGVEGHPPAIGQVTHPAEVLLGGRQDGPVELAPQELGHGGLAQERGAPGEVLHVGEEVGGAPLLPRAQDGSAPGREPVEPTALPLRVRSPLGLAPGPEREGTPGGARQPVQHHVGEQRRRGGRVLGVGRGPGHPQDGPGLLLPPAAHQLDGAPQRPLLGVRGRGQQVPEQHLARSLVRRRSREGARTAQHVPQRIEHPLRAARLGHRQPFAHQLPQARHRHRVLGPPSQVALGLKRGHHPAGGLLDGAARREPQQQIVPPRHPRRELQAVEGDPALQHPRPPTQERDRRQRRLELEEQRLPHRPSRVAPCARQAGPRRQPQAGQRARPEVTIERCPGERAADVGLARGAHRRQRQRHDERRPLAAARGLHLGQGLAEKPDPEGHQRVSAPAPPHPRRDHAPGQGRVQRRPELHGRSHVRAAAGGCHRGGHRRQRGVVLAQDQSIEIVARHEPPVMRDQDERQLGRGRADDRPGIGRDLDGDGKVRQRGAQGEAEPRRVEPQESRQISAGRGMDLEASGCKGCGHAGRRRYRTGALATTGAMRESTPVSDAELRGGPCP